MVSLRDLAAEIGISQAMLFAYRSGKHEPSLKAWRKLEAAERRAGISPHEARADAAKAADPPKEQSPPPQIPFADLQELNRQLFAMREAQAEALREIAALRRDQQRAIEAHMRETAALRAKLAALEDGRPAGEPLA